jgi:hypothetical protein
MQNISSGVQAYVKNIAKHPADMFIVKLEVIRFTLIGTLFILRVQLIQSQK